MAAAILAFSSLLEGVEVVEVELKNQEFGLSHADGGDSGIMGGHRGCSWMLKLSDDLSPVVE